MTRRDLIRRARRQLARAGCRCHPTFHEPPAGSAPEYRGLIEHQGGCPLGDRVAELNRAGIYPPLVQYAPRCDR